MSVSILDIPAELQEKIFSYLKGDSLLAASKVCLQWSFIGHQYMKKQCLSEIPDDVLEEMETEISEGAEDYWKVMYIKWLEESITPSYHYNKVLSKDVDNTISSMIVGGLVIYLGDTLGFLHVLHPMNQGQSNTPGSDTTKIDLLDGPINCLDLMRQKNLLFAATNSAVHVFQTSNSKYFCLPHRLITNVTISISEHGLSVFKDQLAVASQSQIISLYEFEGAAADYQISVNYIDDVTTFSRVYLWKLWSTKVICVLSKGDITVWDRATKNWIFTSNAYPEIIYLNPCWLFRNFIFCSTLTSRQLLAYWHMDRGISYWVIGRTDGAEPVPSRQYLGAGLFCPHTAAQRDENVISVSLKSQLLVFGTSSGKLLLYKITENFMKKDADLALELGQPSVTLHVSERPIRFINTVFRHGSVFIYYMPDRSVVECIQCFSS